MEVMGELKNALIEKCDLPLSGDLGHITRGDNVSGYPSGHAVPLVAIGTGAVPQPIAYAIDVKTAYDVSIRTMKQMNDITNNAVTSSNDRVSGIGFSGADMLAARGIKGSYDIRYNAFESMDKRYITYSTDLSKLIQTSDIVLRDRELLMSYSAHIGLAFTGLAIANVSIFGLTVRLTKASGETIVHENCSGTGLSAKVSGNHMMLASGHRLGIRAQLYSTGVNSVVLFDVKTNATVYGPVPASDVKVKMDLVLRNNGPFGDITVFMPSLFVTETTEVINTPFILTH